MSKFGFLYSSVRYAPWASSDLNYLQISRTIQRLTKNGKSQFITKKASKQWFITIVQVLTATFW